jgi:hypothetical protein
MIKQILLCSTLLITGATNMNAQSKSSVTKTGRSVNYKILLDNPDKLRPLFIAFDAVTADTWGSSSYMGYGLRANLNASHYGSLAFDYRKGYLGAKQRALELGGSLNLIASRKKKDAFVVLSSSTFTSGSKMFMKNSGIAVPAVKKIVLQARGGIASFRAPIDESPDGLGKTANEDPRSFYMTKDTNSVRVGFGKGYKGVFGFKALMKMQVYYVGMSISTIRNVAVLYGDDVASNTNHYNFFVDILSGGDPRFSDASYYYSLSGLGTYDFPIGTRPEEYSISSQDIKKTGWRAGWEVKTNTSKNLTYKVEFGSRPGYRMGSGILSANSYLMVSAGLSFCAGKSFKKMIKEKRDE